MRGIITRSLAAIAVLGGIALTGAGVAAADTGRPTGGDNASSNEPSCGASDINFAQGCFFGFGYFFK